VTERDPAVPAEPLATRSPAHWILVALAPACLVVLVVLGTLVTPSASGHGTHTQLGLPPCLSMEWLGMPCPGCGVTTATALAAHGRLVDAFRNQPLGLVAAALLALYPLWAIVQLARGRDLAEAVKRIDPRLWVPTTIVLILGSWVYKLATGFPA
jgi:hypothetical protein